MEVRMRNDELGVLLAIVGLGLWLAFAQTARHLAVNKGTQILGVLLIPVAIAALWRIALGLSWWTILVFVLASLIVGVLNGVALVRLGKEAVYAMQPYVGFSGITAIAASWFFR